MSLLVERSVLEPPDMQDAEDVVAAQQRDAEHHLDALLPQDRIRDRRRVDAVQPHGILRCGDTSGEARSERNAHSLANFVLDAARRPRHQFLGLLVEQQHRGRVDIKNLAHAGQQLDEQIIDIEVRERAVGQRPEVRQTLRDRPVIAEVRQLGRWHTLRMPDGSTGGDSVSLALSTIVNPGTFSGSRRSTSSPSAIATYQSHLDFRATRRFLTTSTFPGSRRIASS